MDGMGAAEGDLESPEIAEVSCQLISTLYPNLGVKEKCVQKSMLKCYHIFFQLYFLIVLLEYSCFSCTTLCWFLLYNEVNQLCVYIYPLPLEPPLSPAPPRPRHPTPLGHHRALSRAPCAI